MLGRLGLDKDARNRENKMLLTDTPKKLLMTQVTVTRLTGEVGMCKK